MVKCIKCGDTEFCAQCTNHGRVPAEATGYLRMNDLGRCDFYDGPENRRRQAHTHGHESEQGQV